MVTLKEAIKRAETVRDSKIVRVVDCGDRWAFDFEDDYPQPASFSDDNLPNFVKEVIAAPDVIPTFMFKDDGRMELFYISESLDLLEKGVEVVLREDEQ